MAGQTQSPADARGGGSRAELAAVALAAPCWPHSTQTGGAWLGGSPRLCAGVGSLSEVDNSCPWVFLSQTLTKAFMLSLAECTRKGFMPCGSMCLPCVEQLWAGGRAAAPPKQWTAALGPVAWWHCQCPFLWLPVPASWVCLLGAGSEDRCQTQVLGQGCLLECSGQLFSSQEPEAQPFSHHMQEL